MTGLVVVAVLLSQAQSEPPPAEDAPLEREVEAPRLDPFRPELPVSTPGPVPRAATPSSSFNTGRFLASSGVGALGAGLALGLTLLLQGSSTGFDTAFTTAALGGLLVAGGAFTIHRLMQGRGEVVAAAFVALATMAAAALLVVPFTSPLPQERALAVAAVGAIPAGLLSGLILEATSQAGRTAF